MVTGTELFTERQRDPWWREAVPSLDRETSLPAGYVDGWTFTTPVIEMPVHLRGLSRRVDELGGTITRLNLSALPTGADLVIDCAGLGARHLAADRSVTPVAGQVVVVEQFGLDRWWLDAAGPPYGMPPPPDVVVGGTDAEESGGRGGGKEG